MTPSPRLKILYEHAKRTAFAAVKFPGFQLAGGGAPVGLLLDEVAWSEVLDESKGPISCEDFNAWHKCQTEALCDRAKPHLKEGWSEFPVGWSVKLINIYLKTVAYVGNLGRPGLSCALHPPLDSSVKKGLMEHFKGQPAMVAKVDFGAIKDITTYERYRTVIDGCEVAAKDLRCSLFEVEQFFSPMGPASHNPFFRASCETRDRPSFSLPEAAGRGTVSGRDAAFAGWQ